jgi:alkylhydroperoxidase family enzyme
MLFGDRDPTVQPGTATGSAGNYWTVLANSPDSFALALATIELMRRDDITDPIYKELGIVRASWDRGSQFCYSQHCKSLRSLGVPDEKIEAIRFWQSSGLFAPTERLVLAYADDLALNGGRVPDERMMMLRENFTDEQIVELTHVIALWEMHSTILKALKLEFDDRPDPVTEVAGDADSLMSR